jgi:hypothetical protein
MDAISSFAFDCGSGGEVGGFFKSGDKFGPAVGIAAVIGGIDAYEDIERAQNLGAGKSIT